MSLNNDRSNLADTSEVSGSGSPRNSTPSESSFVLRSRDLVSSKEVDGIVVSYNVDIIFRRRTFHFDQSLFSI